MRSNRQLADQSRRLAQRTPRLDAAPGLVDVEHVPQRGDLAGRVARTTRTSAPRPARSRPATAPAPIDSAAPLVPATMASEKLSPAWASMSIS